MPRQAVVVFRQGTAVFPQRSSRSHAAAAAVADADSYRAAVDALEAAVRSGDSGLALDFAPTANYARKFLNTTAAHVVRETVLGRRAIAALGALLVGPPPARRVGRKKLPQPSVPQRDQVAAAWPRWAALVAAAWDADDFVELLVREAPEVIPHRKAILRLRWRAARARPGDLVAHLVAWQLGIPLRRVRAARRAPDVITG
jgi:hypothetical protein